MTKGKRTKHKWCVFRVDIKTFSQIRKELDKQGYEDIRVYVPTLSILKKRSKGRDIYEQVPLLFNYGFIRLTQEQTYSRPFLKKLQKSIPSIVSFLHNLESMHTKKKRKRIDGEDFDDYSVVATVSSSEVRRFKKLSRENEVYSFEELSNIQIGDYIVLRGYPFNGIEATVLDINLKSKLVKVSLYPNNGQMEVYLPFANVVYSTYRNYNEDILLTNHNELNIATLTNE